MMITIALITACSFLIAAILVQNNKGGLQSQTVKNIVGAKHATPFIEKATFTLAILVVLFAMMK